MLPAGQAGSGWGMERGMAALLSPQGTGLWCHTRFRILLNTDSCAMFCRYDLDLMSTLDWDEDEEFGETPEQMFPGGYDQVQR